MIDCKPCGFAHLDPIPDAEMLTRHYQTYYSKTKPNFESEHEEDADWWADLYNDRLEQIECRTEGRRLLDVGCGPGYFCEAAKARGWRAEGCDPCADMLAGAIKSGAAVYHCGADNLPTGKYDLVTLWEVLEHLPDPAKALRDCRDRLNPGGMLAVQVPNDFNRLQDNRGYWVVFPDHVNYFNRKSLQRLLKRCGFNPVHAETSFPMELFLLSGMDYVAKPEIGRRAHKLRMWFDSGLSADRRRFLYSMMANADMGRDLYVLSQIT